MSRPYDSQVIADHSILDFFEAVPTPEIDLEGIDLSTQAGLVLSVLASHSPRPRSTIQIREEAKVENVSGRISELRAGGWRIETVSMRGPDGTATYRLTSRAKREPRRVDISLEVIQDSWDGLVVKVRPTGLSDTFSTAQLDDLRGQVEATVEQWMESMQEEADDLQVEPIEEPKELNLWDWLDEVDDVDDVA